MVPLSAPVEATVTVPGSKSITNRALVLAALGRGKTVLQGALWSEDTQVMVDCLRKLGFEVEVVEDPAERCNRTITVEGREGWIPGGGTPEHPLDLFVGNAGTAARFLAAFVCLGRGVYRLHGVNRMNERPQAALFAALRGLGYRIDARNDKLPAVIHGAGPKPGKCRVSIAESSQFASALLLSGTRGGWEIEVEGENADESPYVSMTTQLIDRFPREGGLFRIEPDASSGSYFWGAGWLLAQGWPSSASQVSVAHWPRSGWQIDAEFPKYLPPPRTVSRRRDLGDSIMTLIVLAPFLPHPVRFTDLGRLRLQECERVQALATELAKCGAKVIDHGSGPGPNAETLEVFPSALHGAEIETYNDHRMAMCFAILGLKIPGIRIKNPACVKKTFPNFFEKLALAPPLGLGALICEAESGRALKRAELFAE